MSEINFTSNISAVAKEDILDLHNKIQSFTSGEVDEEKFRSFRLARGVYGQRQPGVQMIRIKLPYGCLSANQLIRIADVADKYATEKMHTTTRQDIQIHFVKLSETPALWSELEDAGITLREACGNTVRNVTASAKAGIDPNELFDVSPYAHAYFEYFLRNPICQEMGRKFKVAFSSSDDDTAYTYMHDLGFIPRIENGVKGFKVMVGGGLGSQPIFAHVAYEFLPIELIIPFSEAVIRVFDRYGERASRGKARMKFLLKNIGFDAFMQLVEEEKKAVIKKVYPIDEAAVKYASASDRISFDKEEPKDVALFEKWRATNVFEQKQKGFYGVAVKLLLGNIYNETARKFAAIIKDGFCADDIRVTVNQGFMLRYVREEALVGLFNRLYDLNLTDPGFDSTQDITTCPGTDTCNLGIASSYGISVELERIMKEEFPDLIYNNDIKIKISGCMNACGQHMIANIGFQGMSIKKGEIVMPAMQVLLGGGFNKEGVSTIADKVVKVPSRVAPDAFRALIQDYDENALEGEYYNNYYTRKIAEDKMYFFAILKPFTVLPAEIPAEFMMDWGNEATYEKAIGVGECAGVILDLVATLILEAEEKIQKAEKLLAEGNWENAIYLAYTSFIVGAKALLTGDGIACNTHISILEDFQKHFVETGSISFGGKTFLEVAVQQKENEPSLEFSKKFIADAKSFASELMKLRVAQIERNKEKAEA